MARVTVAELSRTLRELQAQMAEITERLAELEGRREKAHVDGVAAPAVAAEAGITEEELLAISAAIGAYLGVQAHIRQIRLVSSGAWSQQGRLSIQASHRLQG
jgi:methylmalonyl-CoA carboxyltransferase large subunit